MSTRAVVTLLRCDETRTDTRRPEEEIRCLSEFQHAGDFDATRSAAARAGWIRVRGSEPWVSDLFFDVCPVCKSRRSDAPSGIPDSISISSDPSASGTAGDSRDAP